MNIRKSNLCGSLNSPWLSLVACILCLDVALTAQAWDRHEITHLNSTLAVLSLSIQTGPGSYDPDFNPGLGTDGAVFAVAEQENGQMVIGGYFTQFNLQPRTGLARLNPEGTLDPAFAPPLEDHDGGGRAIVHTVLIQPNGKIVVGGQLRSAEDDHWRNLIRFNPDGTLDRSFNPGLSPNWPVQTIARQADGKLLIGGAFESYNGVARLGLARLTADGLLDPSFNVGDGLYCQPLSLAIQSDGRILVAGHLQRGNASLTLIRLMANGAVDNSFPALDTLDSVRTRGVRTVLVQPDGKILIGGWFTNVNGASCRHLARLLPNGNPDPAFNANTGLDSSVQTLALQANGKIIVGGFFTHFADTSRHRIARLQTNGILDPSFDPGTGVEGGPLDDEWVGPMVYCSLLRRDGKILIGGSFASYNGIPAQGIARLLSDDLIPSSWAQRHLPDYYAPTRSFTVRLDAQPASTVSVYAIEDAPPEGWAVSTISHDGIFDRVTGKVKFGPFFDARLRSLTYSVTPPAGSTGSQFFSGAASADGINHRIGGDQRIEAIPRLHPADIQPPARSIGIGEVTAYGAAWRRGESWPVPPNPIPIDYVTRAAALWKAGEVYEVNPACLPPLCWTPPDEIGKRDVDGVLSNAAASQSRAECQIPSGSVPGEQVMVNLQVTPSATVRAYALEHQFPADWQVSDISSGGELDAQNHKVKWGPFLDSMPRALSYQAVPPIGASGVAVFSGAASFDGASIAVAGPHQLRAVSRLGVGFQPATGGLVLRLAGPANSRYRIETSTDLARWLPLMEVTVSPGGTIFPLTSNPGKSPRFFRGQLIP